MRTRSPGQSLCLGMTVPVMAAKQSLFPMASNVTLPYFQVVQNDLTCQCLVERHERRPLPI